MSFFAGTYAEVFSITAGPPLHDPLAVAAAIYPEIFDDKDGERFQVDIEGAGHNSFTDLCRIAEVLEAAAVPARLLEGVVAGAEDACGPGRLDVAEAHRLIRRYVVAFFERFLAGDDSRADDLAPTDGVSFRASG